LESAFKFTTQFESGKQWIMPHFGSLKSIGHIESIVRFFISDGFLHKVFLAKICGDLFIAKIQK